ncbi:MAG: ABC transporter permease [Actinomycetia bacterium]|nr:ABC transporter permease [Actinomycetes bacterium]
MRKLLTLINRNLQVYRRDPMTVFFSFLSPLILFVLFLVFFRHSIAGIVTDSIPGATSADSYALCDEWLFASVATLSTFSTSLAMLTSFVDDRVTGRFSDYLVSPIRRWQLGLAYVLSTFLVSVVVSVVLMGVGQGWAILHDQPLLSPVLFLRSVLGITAGCLVFSAYNTLIVTFTASQGSFGGYAIIMGTSMGFLSFCYVPPSQLGQGLNSTLSAMPFAQVGALIRLPAMEPATQRLMAPIPPAARDAARLRLIDALGARLSVHNTVLSIGVMLLLILAVTIILASFAAWRMGRVIR